MTEQGIYSIYHLGLVALGPLVANRLLVGDFQGLEVLEPYCEDPVILTTEKISGFIVVNMVGESHFVGYIEPDLEIILSLLGTGSVNQKPTDKRISPKIT